MIKMGYKNFRDPVEYILKQELRKKDFKNKINTNLDDSPYIGPLPEYPVNLIRENKTNKIVKCIYAMNTNLEWCEILIRNSKGKVYRIKTIYPNKSEKTVQINRGGNQKVISVTYVD